MRLLILLGVVLLVACGDEGSQSNTTAPALPEIYAVNYPLAWAAQQLAEDSATVQFPAPAGVDPAAWQPDSETVGRYQRADLVLLNGAGYAGWLARVSMPRIRLVNTSRNFSDQLITADSGPVHSHGPEGDHSHGGEGVYDMAGPQPVPATGGGHYRGIGALPVSRVTADTGTAGGD